ncbi:hypothetical protein FGB62_6g227 [Gracilaria domingensis]|nr:hypothetical protein FGB62_6g227 [Gracilaria domingensis]
MPRPVAVLATIVAGTAVRLLAPHLPFFRKRRNPEASQAPQFEDFTDEEDASHSEQESLTDMLPSPYHAGPSRTHHLPSQHKPVLCAADVLTLLNSIAPRSNDGLLASAQCTFCLEYVKSGQQARTTPCKHVFHANCLEQWVLHATTKLMTPAMYTVARDGTVRCSARFPSCPNCSSILDVVPRPVWSFVLLSAVTSSLSLSDNRHAAEMYRSGMVVRDDILRQLYVRIPAEERGVAFEWIESIDDDDSSSIISREDGLRQSGMTPLVSTPARTRAEQRGFGRTDTRLAFASKMCPSQ